MLSRWYEYKTQAVILRLKGYSVRDIEKRLGIPRSTLSGWFKNIKLTKEQRLILNSKKLKSLDNARKKAVLWHNKQKLNRLDEAKNQSKTILSKIDTQNSEILELALSMLYLGEGSKSRATTMGNSNPLIVKFFIRSIAVLYNIDQSKLKCELHLRSDQDPIQVVEFWSRELSLPRTNFTFCFDKRTIKSKTYPEYKGVCVVRCGRVALQRRLSFLSEGFCEKIVDYKDS